MKKIRVLVVDDSIVFREVLARGISSDPYIEVVATASDPFDARDKIIKYEPDVMTCDIEMPKMNGIEFVKRLIPQYPIPVIMVTTVSGAVFEAIKVGAVDFVTKPDVGSVRNVKDFIYEMIQKVKIASVARVGLGNNRRVVSKVSGHVKHQTDTKIIAIGASTGGTEAISKILKSLPNSTPGIVVVQHIPPVFSQMFAERLNDSTSFSVKEAQTGDYVETGHVFIAPGDQHMKIKKVGERFRIDCFKGEKVSGHRPSVDVLFESVAEQAKDNAVGVILTGMGYDGAKGLLLMKRKGARTIGQDEDSAVVYGMPKVAYDIGAIEKQVPLNDIPQTVFSFINGG